MNTKATDLIEQITNAFAGVKLEDGVSLNMTEYNDSGGCRPDYKEKALFDERDDWRAIPDETLEQFIVTFSFTDLKGFRFYIPAYMIWTIRNYENSYSPIGECTIYAIDPAHYLFETIPFLEWFTSPQISAMMSFLDYIDDDYADVNLKKIQEAQQAAPRNH